MGAVVSAGFVQYLLDGSKVSYIQLVEKKT